ncbi:MAG: tetratricopeptide repeat protein [Opitutales bacterium]
MKKIAVLLSILAGLSGAYGQGIDWQLTREYWNSQEFVDQFMGTYGVNSEIEPKINSEEAELFKQVVPLVKTNIDQAIQLMTDYMAGAEEASAALDFTLGNLYFQKGDLQRAVRAYNEALRKFPNFLRVYKNLGFLNVQRGNYQEAIPNLVKVISLGEGGGDLYGVLGFCYLSTGKPASAENAYRQALLLEPEKQDWKNGLIRSLMEQREFAEVIGLLEEAIIAKPGSRELWLYQANAFLEVEDFEKAIANLVMANKIGLSTARSMMLLGDLLMQENLAEEALEAYKVSLAKGGNMQNQQFIRAATVLVNQGNFAEGLEYLEEIEKARGEELTDKQRMTVLNTRSEIYLATGRQDEAAETLETIIAEDPANGQALLLLAEYYSNQGDIEQAVFFYERAQNLRDYEVKALVDHARLMVQEKNFEKAVELLRRAQLIEPRDNVERYLEAVEKALETQRR